MRYTMQLCLNLLTRSRTKFSNITNNFVGLERTKYTIHRDILTANSVFFHDALRGNSDEARDGAIKLEESIPQIFEIFTRWLYKKAIEFEHDEFWFRTLSNAWILGDELSASNFQNSIIDALISKFKDTRELTEVNTINNIYNKTVPGSPLRRLLVDFFAWQYTPDDARHSAPLSPEVHRDFIVDLADIALRGWDEGHARDFENAPFSTNPRMYHKLEKGKARRDERSDEIL